MIIIKTFARCGQPGGSAAWHDANREKFAVTRHGL
jgi:hypothetical protein